MSASSPNAFESISTTATSGDHCALPPPWLLISLFFLALLPLTVWYVLHHPDERHYTDAGIAMVQSGDLLTPRRADGSLRFNKPILSYWLVAGSYWLLGISPFASRFPFLLAGCATVFATYRLGKLLGESEASGRWAALVAMGNLQVILASTRSIPDILLCLFVTVSCFGFLSIIFFDRRTWQVYACAYIGLGLAIASKGVPAVIVVGAVVSCAMLSNVFVRREEWNFGQLVHIPAIAWGALIAGGWFVLMYSVHGHVALSQFAQDQVGVRFEATVSRRLYHFAIFLGWCAPIGLPWMLPVALNKIERHGASRRCVAFASTPAASAVPLSRGQRRRAITTTIIAAVLLVAAATSFCNFISSRYILPVVPLCASVIGVALAGVSRELVHKTFRPILLIGLGTLVMVAGALVIANFQTGHVAAALICAIAAFGLVLTVTFRTFTAQKTHPAIDLGVLKMAALPLVAMGLFHFMLPDDAQRASATLSRDTTQRQEVQVIGKPSLASKLQVYRRGELALHNRQHVPAGFHPTAGAVLVTDDADLARINLASYRVETFDAEIRNVNSRELFRAAYRGRLQEYLDQHRKTFALAVRTRGH